MWAGGRDSEWTPLPASQGCVQHQVLTLMYGFEAARLSGTAIIPGSESHHHGMTVQYAADPQLLG